MPRPAGALNSASRSAQVRWPLSIFLLFLLVLAQKTFTWLLGGPAAAAPRVLGRTARPGRRVRVVGAIELDQRVHLASLGRLVTIFLGVLALGLTKKCCSHLASRTLHSYIPLAPLSLPPPSYWHHHSGLTGFSNAWGSALSLVISRLSPIA